MRNCRGCGEVFEPTPRHVRRSDWICLPCERKVLREYRLARKLAGRPVPRSPAKPRKTAQKSQVYRPEYYVEYRRRPDVKERLKAYDRARLQNPVAQWKARARQIARYAIARGRLAKQPCEFCGSDAVQAHHDDYSKPLEVRWLCPRHHAAVHRALRAAA